MTKQAIIDRIIALGIVAVVRAENSDMAHKIAESCIKGGIPAIEVTFTVPNALAVIADLSASYKESELLIGAGTVLDSVTAKAAIFAGAKYIVSPGFDLETMKLCNKLDVPYLPGCLTLTEMITATKAGAEIIKLFPGSAFGPGYVKAVKGPLPHIKIMPTGGVGLENVKEWFKNGVVAVGVGGELTAPAKQGDYAAVEERARAFVKAIHEARI